MCTVTHTHSLKHLITTHMLVMQLQVDTHTCFTQHLIEMHRCTTLPPHLNPLTPKQKYEHKANVHTQTQQIQVCAHKHTPVVSGQHTENSLVFKLSVPLKVSTACEEDLTDRENTHIHTHTLR